MSICLCGLCVSGFCLDSIFLTFQHFVTKLGIVTHHYELKCHSKKRKLDLQSSRSRPHAVVANITKLMSVSTVAIYTNC